MKKTSRRSFGKQLTGAMAALPVASLVMNESISGQVKPKTPKVGSDQNAFKEHDTPPPTFFMSGSLIFEATTDKNDWDNFQPFSTTAGVMRRKWTVVPKPYSNGMSPTNIYVAHVKLISGAGDLLFHFDNDDTLDKSTPVHVTATVEKNGVAFGDCHLTATGNHFEIDMPNLKKFKKKNNDPSTNPALRQRVRFMHDNDDEQCDWVALRIDKGTVNLYNNTSLTLLPGFADLKVMVWWENI